MYPVSQFSDKEGKNKTGHHLPVAVAAASKQLVTFCRSTLTSSLVGALIVYRSWVYSGIMFGFTPPSVMIPCTLHVGFICCRNMLMLL